MLEAGLLPFPGSVADPSRSQPQSLTVSPAKEQANLCPTLWDVAMEGRHAACICIAMGNFFFLKIVFSADLLFSNPYQVDEDEMRKQQEEITAIMKMRIACSSSGTQVGGVTFLLRCTVSVLWINFAGPGSEHRWAQGHSSWRWFSMFPTTKVATLTSS